MVIKCYIVVFLMLWANSLFAQGRIDSTVTIEKILAQPEDQIDIGLADLVLAKDFYPEMKIESFLYAFDYMANKFNASFGNITDPDKRIRAMNTFLYKKGIWNDSITFSYDENDLGIKELSNKFINGYISTKHGSCITMPMMYVILGERLGYPIHASRLPYHFFVRYLPEKKNSKFHENIEATNGGSYVSNKEYKGSFNLPDKAIKNGVYERTLTKREYIASLLLINANEWIVRKDLEKAKYYLDVSMKYDTTFSSAYMNYAMLHFQEARELEEKLMDEKQSEITFYNASKNKVTYPLPTPVQRQSAPQPNYESFHNPIAENQAKPNIQPIEESKVNAGSSNDAELQASLATIEQKYAPLILAKLDVYRQYKKKAEVLGIVRGYPLMFFQKQSKSLKHFQEKGVQ